jgi:hypothetical protein
MDTPRIALVGFEEDLAKQRRAVAGRSVPYERALALLPAVLDGPPGRYLQVAWKRRRFYAWYDRPLLLLAALRDDALATGESHPLWDAFAAPRPRAEAVTPEALEAALDGRSERIWGVLARRSVQTNETSRAVAWLWPAALAGASGGGRLIALADIGASAGLNLVADALPNVWTTEDGAPIEIATGVRAVLRLGLDAEPLDASNEDDARWLRACVWPGEPERLARLEDALTAFQAARTHADAPVLVPILARDVPARLGLLSTMEPQALVVAYQTVLSAYLSPDDRKEYEAGMRTWVRAHPPASTVWVELEAAEGAAIEDPHPAALRAHVRGFDGEVETFELARCAYHPRGLVRNAGEVEALRVTLQPRALAEAAARP